MNVAALNLHPALLVFLGICLFTVLFCIARKQKDQQQQQPEKEGIKSNNNTANGHLSSLRNQPLGFSQTLQQNQGLPQQQQSPYMPQPNMAPSHGSMMGGQPPLMNNGPPSSMVGNGSEGIGSIGNPSMAISLGEFDHQIFRPDVDINFERDFGQWFDTPLQRNQCLPQQQQNPYMPQPNMAPSYRSMTGGQPPLMNNGPPSSMGGNGSEALTGIGNPSMAISLGEFDHQIFRPDGDINFERDFGQWYSPPLQQNQSLLQQPQNPYTPQQNITPSPVSMMGGNRSGGLTSIGNPMGTREPPFDAELMRRMAMSLGEFDHQLWRPDGDINFERDFGQWFSPDDADGLDPSMK